MYAILEDLRDENKFYWESMEKLKEDNKQMTEFIDKRCAYYEWSDWCAGGRDDP